MQSLHPRLPCSLLITLLTLLDICMLTSTMTEHVGYQHDPSCPQRSIANTFTPPHQTMMACLIGRVHLPQPATSILL